MVWNEEQKIQAKKVLFIGFIGNKVIFINRTQVLPSFCCKNI